MYKILKVIAISNFYLRNTYEDFLPKRELIGSKNALIESTIKPKKHTALAQTEAKNFPHNRIFPPKQ